MNDDNNFLSTCKEYLQRRCISPAVVEQLEQENLISYQADKICFQMKDLGSNLVCWIQERYLTPIVVNWTERKSKTSAGTKVWCFYTTLDYKLPVFITEWEIDWATLAHLPNVLGIQWIQNLRKTVEALKQKWVTTIYLLVDKDEPADIAIGKLLDMDDTFLSNIFDCRDLLWDCKDINYYICSWKDVSLDYIQLHGKSLWDFKKITDILLVKDKTIKINHSEFAKYMIKRFNISSTQKNLFVYDHANRKWIWQPLDKQYVEKLIMQQLESLLSYIISNFKINDLNHTLDFMIAHANNEEMRAWLLFQSDTEINLFDGILDVNTQQIRDYTKEDYKFQKLTYSRKVFDNYSEPQKMLHFLNEILEWHNNPQAIIDFLQEFIGRLFVWNTSYEKALLIFWSGANGKGVILSIIRELLGGTVNCSSIWLHEINKDQYLYNLVGKLANIDSDMQQNVQLDSGIIKKLVSWENISAKSVYKQPIEFKPYARLLIATNELPYLKTIDNSIRRRFIFLHLKKSFYGKENPNLVNEILEEKNDIFVWCTQWLLRLLKRWFFIVPDELESELGNFIKENDTIELWFEDWEVARSEEAKIHNKDLYPMYRMYCLDNGLKPLSKRTLNRRLREKWFVEFKDGLWRWFEWISLVDNRPF